MPREEVGYPQVGASPLYSLLEISSPPPTQASKRGRRCLPTSSLRMFRVFGHDKIWVLDGGLPQWRASGYDVESSASGDAILKASAASEAIEKVYQGQLVAPTTFEAKLQPHLIWTLEQGEYKRRLDERDSQTTGEGSNHQFDNNIYLDVIGGVSKKGRIYGLGVEAGTLIPSSSTYEFEHCSASELETMRTTIAALTSELQQKEKDVNEMREKLQQQEGKIEQQEGKI